MAELFNVKVNTINYHLKEIFSVNELKENSVVRKTRITASDGKDYFEELLVKIKEIRASERRFYQKITDIYKECSYDYDKNSEITKEFYKNVQNTIHAIWQHLIILQNTL